MFVQEFAQLLLVAAAGVAVVLLARRNSRVTAGSPGDRESEAPRYAKPAALLKRPVLKGISGYYAGAVIPFDDSEWVLGSDPAVSNLVFPNSVEGIAKRHCMLRYDTAARQVLLQDAWSESGTFLADGTALQPGTPLGLATGMGFYLATPDQSFEIGPPEP